jgi:hypothetical protein
MIVVSMSFEGMEEVEGRRESGVRWRFDEKATDLNRKT